MASVDDLQDPPGEGCCCPCACEIYDQIEIEWDGEVSVDEEFGDPKVGDREWRFTMNYSSIIPIDYTKEGNDFDCAWVAHGPEAAPDECDFVWAPDVGLGQDCQFGEEVATYPDPAPVPDPPTGDPWPSLSDDVVISLSSLDVTVDCAGNGTAELIWTESTSISDIEFGHVFNSGTRQQTITMVEWAGNSVKETEWNTGFYSGTNTTTASIVFSNA